MSFNVLLDCADGNVAKVLLKGPVIVREAAVIKSEFAALLRNYHTAEIYLDHIQSIDIAGLQLLAALKQSAAGAGKSFTLHTNSSAATQAAFTLAGFTHLLSAQ